MATVDAASLALLAVIGGWWAPSASVVDIEVTIRRMAGAADRRRPNVVSIVLFTSEDELSREANASSSSNTLKTGINFHTQARKSVPSPFDAREES
jgi:hypothetical protein